jgi:hypothetical protein
VEFIPRGAEDAGIQEFIDRFAAHALGHFAEQHEIRIAVDKLRPRQGVKRSLENLLQNTGLVEGFLEEEPGCGNARAVSEELAYRDAVVVRRSAELGKVVRHRRIKRQLVFFEENGDRRRGSDHFRDRG